MLKRSTPPPVCYVEIIMNESTYVLNKEEQSITKKQGRTVKIHHSKAFSCFNKTIKVLFYLFL